MPAPKSRQASDESSVADQLRRFLNPLDVVILTRDRLQDVLEDAVARGRMTRDDATELLAELTRRGRRQTEDVLSDIERLLAGARGGRPVDLEPVARAAATLGDLLAARPELAQRLDALSRADLVAVRDYERRNANRKSVLAAVERRLDS
jgi:hypothetical protein